MIFAFSILTYFTYFADCTLLLWSPQQLRVPALRVMEWEDFEEVLSELKQPNVLSFRADLDKAFAVIPRKLGNLRSAYIPMTNFQLENAQDLGDDLDLNTELIKDTLEQHKKNNSYEDVLLAISLSNNRVKRQDADKNETESTTTTTITESSIPENIGPVVYNGKNVIVYSAQPPRLRINTSTLSLGSSTIVNTDDRDGYIRLIITVVVEDGKVILRFKFPIANGYWSLASVEVVHQPKNESKSYNLTITSNVGAAHSFSYHCHKDTIFKDATGNVELVFYKLQAQPDAKNGRFSDAYNCVNFMTGPIWSGILVTVSLIIGFFIALAALGDIKTMDKFDNYRTKQLNITVAE